MKTPNWIRIVNEAVAKIPYDKEAPLYFEDVIGGFDLPLLEEMLKQTNSLKDGAMNQMHIDYADAVAGKIKTWIEIKGEKK